MPFQPYPKGAAAGAAVLVFLSGCASTAATEQMAVAIGEAPSPVRGSPADHALRLGSVTGAGERPDSKQIADLTNASLGGALQQSLGNLGYLAATPQGAAYQVDVEAVEISRPAVAFDPVIVFVPVTMPVTVRLRYTVRPAGGGDPVYQTLVATTAEATTSDAGGVGERVQLAMERAVRLNTIGFAERMSEGWK